MRHATVELDVAWEDDRTLPQVIASMVAPPSRVGVDEDRTSCCSSEEVWYEDDSYYGCDHCGQPTRPTIEHEVVLERGPGGGWPLVAFHGPYQHVEYMLDRHGYEGGLPLFEVTD